MEYWCYYPVYYCRRRWLYSNCLLMPMVVQVLVRLKWLKGLIRFVLLQVMVRFARLYYAMVCRCCPGRLYLLLFIGALVLLRSVLLLARQQEPIRWLLLTSMVAQVLAANHLLTIRLLHVLFQVPCFYCAGGSTQICASANSAYLWNTGATTQCITVGAGDYTVTVTDGNGCTSSCTAKVDWAS